MSAYDSSSMPMVNGRSATHAVHHTRHTHTRARRVGHGYRKNNSVLPFPNNLPCHQASAMTKFIVLAFVSAAFVALSVDAAECEQATLTTLLASASVSTCSSDSGYSFASLSAATEDVMASMCASDACVEVLNQFSASGLGECTVSGVSLLEELVDPVTLYCAGSTLESTTTTATTSPSAEGAITSAEPSLLTLSPALAGAESSGSSSSSSSSSSNGSASESASGASSDLDSSLDASAASVGSSSSGSSTSSTVGDMDASSSGSLEIDTREIESASASSSSSQSDEDTPETETPATVAPTDSAAGSPVPSLAASAAVAIALLAASL